MKVSNESVSIETFKLKVKLKVVQYSKLVTIKTYFWLLLVDDPLIRRSSIDTIMQTLAKESELLPIQSKLANNDRHRDASDERLK